jgi:hypothetical protein
MCGASRRGSLSGRRRSGSAPTLLPRPLEQPRKVLAALCVDCHRACSSRKAANITRTIFGSNSPRCASVNGATLWTMGAAARKMRALHLSRVHRADLHLEPGGLQQLAHAGGDDAVKLAGVGGPSPKAVSGGRACYRSHGHRYCPSQGEIDPLPALGRAPTRPGALISVPEPVLFPAPPENEEAGSPQLVPIPAKYRFPGS